MDSTISAGFSARPYDLRLHVWSGGNSGNSSRYNWNNYVYSRSGYGSFQLTPTTWNVAIGGQGFSGSRALDFRPDSTGKTISIGSGLTNYFGHDGNGNLAFGAGASWTIGPYGTADTGTQTMYADRIPATPSAPGNPSWSSVAYNQANAAWTAASRGNANIDQYLLRVHTNPNPDAAGYRDIVLGATVLSTTVTGLSASTTYYSKTYAHNSDGYGPGSGVTPFTTPAPPPTPSAPLNPRVTAKAADGSSVDFAWDPPATGAPITGYQLSYAIPGQGEGPFDVAASPTTAHYNVTTVPWRNNPAFEIAIAAKNAGGVGPTVSLFPFANLSAGFVKVFDGSAFGKKPIKRYNGAGWDIKPLKRYDGSAWITL